MQWQTFCTHPGCDDTLRSRSTDPRRGWEHVAWNVDAGAYQAHTVDHDPQPAHSHAYELLAAAPAGARLYTITLKATNTTRTLKAWIAGHDGYLNALWGWELAHLARPLEDQHAWRYSGHGYSAADDLRRHVGALTHNNPHHFDTQEL